MRLTKQQIEKLHEIFLKNGYTVNDETAQSVGLAILRFVIAKTRTKKIIAEMEMSND